MVGSNLAKTSGRKITIEGKVLKNTKVIQPRLSNLQLKRYMYVKKNIFSQNNNIVCKGFCFTNETLSEAVLKWCGDEEGKNEMIAKYGDISTWDTSKVTQMASLFRFIPLQPNQHVPGADTFNDDISNWNVSNVTTMYSMFEGAAQFNQDLGNWNVSNVIDMEAMFNGASNFEQDLSNWNVSGVKLNHLMFKNAISFSATGLENWNLSSIETIGGQNLSYDMLKNANVNQNQKDLLEESWVTQNNYFLQAEFDGIFL